MDFVIGNHGLNSRFKATAQQPVTLYVNDFDRNGTVEQILCEYNGGISYPMVLRYDLVTQVPSLKKKYLKYESYKDQTITDIFTPEQMEGAVKLEAYDFATSVLNNGGDGKLTLRALPAEAQLSPMYGIEIDDVDGDGFKDIIMGGNLSNVKPEVGRYDASYGLLLRGDGKGNFNALPVQQSGIRIIGEVRDIVSLKDGVQKRYIVAKNNDTVIVLKRSKHRL
jgi:hypothetical protein